MTTYTIVATTVANAAEEAELDTHIDDFQSLDEVIGYARRMAEEMFGLVTQLDLDLEYSHVSLFEGDQGEAELDADSPAFLGMWFFSDDGAGYATAEDLRAAEADAAEHDGEAPDTTPAETAAPASGAKH